MDITVTRELVAVIGAIALILSAGGIIFLTGDSQRNVADISSLSDCSSGLSYEGAGTTANPYEIDSVSKLQCITIQGADKHYALVSNIDATSTNEWDEGEGFMPIGTHADAHGSQQNTAFTGVFDGNGHSIDGLTIERSTADSVGLFAEIGNQSSVHNVTVSNATVTGYQDVGILVGLNRGTLSDASTSGRVTGEFDDGGLVGENRATIRTSSADGHVSGSDDTGGLVGKNTGSITSSSARGRTDGGLDVGGLVGFQESNASVTSSSAVGTVRANRNNVGGLVGRNRGTVSESFADSRVVGNQRIGGLVGFQNLGGTVEKSFANGYIEGEQAGALVGNMYNNGTVRRSLATGRVNATNEFSGGVLAKDGDGTSTVSRSYWDSVSTGENSSTLESDGATGFTTDTNNDQQADELTGQAAASNMQLDFERTWTTTTDAYPVLQALD